ncbi:MAG: LLM class F420-dependent oxidoreductase [Gammaproteobacteria bacterium]|nr:LLM class F420-dependent oxidoreductase [Gammaproteobacteria bacterium]RPG25332.1 MAG: TIGR03620 family F420-dependent LLM class oxidoreductase [Gammaproteobacteria bacterium TMED50]|tara:strand:+ start:5558 stop:6490 length:933 start_codon:yes stop_codon:yes gene_type:complete
MFKMGAKDEKEKVMSVNLGKTGVWYFTDAMSAADAAAFAQHVESLGYGALWIPETIGRNSLVHAAWLLANTTRLVVATGIASIYNRDAGAMMAAAHTLVEQSEGRFLLGLGVSHQPLVEGVRGHQYGKPVSTMREYLTRMKATPYQSIPAENPPEMVLAALGPNMLALSRNDADGAHPYFTTPEHTRLAREVLGPDKLLCVEQKVVLETDPAVARQAARQSAAMYLGLENYRNNWKRLGFSDEDLEGGGSDAFIDATFAWGSVDQIRERVEEHLSAGASHVCMQPVSSAGMGVLDNNALEALSPAKSAAA